MADLRIFISTPASVFQASVVKVLKVTESGLLSQPIQLPGGHIHPRAQIRLQADYEPYDPSAGSASHHPGIIPVGGIGFQDQYSVGLLFDIDVHLSTGHRPVTHHHDSERKPVDLEGDPSRVNRCREVEDDTSEGHRNMGVVPWYEIYKGTTGPLAALLLKRESTVADRRRRTDWFISLS